MQFIFLYYAYIRSPHDHSRCFHTIGTITDFINLYIFPNAADIRSSIALYPSYNFPKLCKACALKQLQLSKNVNLIGLTKSMFSSGVINKQFHSSLFCMFSFGVMNKQFHSKRGVN